MLHDELGSLWVIAAAVQDTDEVRFLRHDPDCGYVFHSIPDTNLIGAHLFRTIEQAEKVYGEMQDRTTRTMTDGTIYPSTGIASALGMNNNRMKAYGDIAILEVRASPIQSNSIRGEIKKPTGFTYD